MTRLDPLTYFNNGHKKNAELAKKEKPPEHWSDCATHNEPAMPNGECDCGGYTPEAQDGGSND